MTKRSAIDAHGPGWYEAAEAAKFSGLSLAMINYLCRSDVVAPNCGCKRGHGSVRHYSFGDLVALRLIGKLAANGVSPLRLKKGMRYLKKVRPHIKFSSLPASHLVTDGKDIYLRDRTEVLERATDGQYVFAFVVELDQLRQEVVKRMTPLHRKLAKSA